jgi:hypothetical protein
VNEANTKVNVLRDLAQTALDLGRIRMRWMLRRPQRAPGEPLRERGELALRR